MIHFDLVVFSHLRWGFVYQRPQHLLSRAAQDRRVYFVEEIVRQPILSPTLEVLKDESGVNICIPHVPNTMSDDGAIDATGRLVAELLNRERIHNYVTWLYTPMALPAINRLQPRAIVYDCMDELSNFKFAPSILRLRERELLASADVVFTGGQSLWEAKRSQHTNCHAMPSSVDAPHFARARQNPSEPKDLTMAHPRVGYYGVIDERLDLELLEAVADELPQVQFVMLGPVVKIDPQSLPRRQNLHYLGQKRYEELPDYLAHWDVAMMPFALNDSTRFISPTKTPEYLAAGKPVVSTAIRDVVCPYAELGLVKIADDAKGFADAVRKSLEEDQLERRDLADAYVSAMSWDLTWRKMEDAISKCVADRARAGLKYPSVLPTKSSPQPLLHGNQPFGTGSPIFAATSVRNEGMPSRLEQTRRAMPQGMPEGTPPVATDRDGFLRSSSANMNNPNMTTDESSVRTRLRGNLSILPDLGLPDSRLPNSSNPKGR